MKKNNKKKIKKNNVHHIGRKKMVSVHDIF